MSISASSSSSPVAPSPLSSACRVFHPVLAPHAHSPALSAAPLPPHPPPIAPDPAMLTLPSHAPASPVPVPGARPTSPSRLSVAVLQAALSLLSGTTQAPAAAVAATNLSDHSNSASVPLPRAAATAGAPEGALLLAAAAMVASGSRPSSFQRCLPSQVLPVVPAASSALPHAQQSVSTRPVSTDGAPVLRHLAWPALARPAGAAGQSATTRLLYDHLHQQMAVSTTSGRPAPSSPLCHVTPAAQQCWPLDANRA